MANPVDLLSIVGQRALDVFMRGIALQELINSLDQHHGDPESCGFGLLFRR